MDGYCADLESMSSEMGSIMTDMSTILKESVKQVMLVTY